MRMCEDVLANRGVKVCAYTYANSRVFISIYIYIHIFTHT